MSVFAERKNHSRRQPQIVLGVAERGRAQVVRLNRAQPEFRTESEIEFAASRPSAVPIRGFKKRTAGFGETGLGPAKKTVSRDPEAPPLYKVLWPDHKIVLCKIGRVVSATVNGDA